MSTDQPIEQPMEPMEPAPGGPHVPSLVTGVAALLVVVLVGVSILTDIHVDTGAVAAVALIVLGGLLVVGGATAGLRGR
ncbi:hypothetical protein SAMN06264364_11880 [Quadrisphaera granulorum]|uniref:Uncharacterized protein n=1 Tax=Quadrisphaera granulorum TaxID=317664 RepID=A0A316A648_9ACTN|nr:hypothetical protein [Quadrisphaera granulorum]PWJ52708.1 hypothetical protein BXY45_11880 [Quadrisphaera granulorum]SZE97530.1 hypothetical protein SAMN06264364_11880 [Quadrisphaera granulorum]